MSTVHGSWILNSDSSYFFIWGETWRTLDGGGSKSASLDVSIHPFNLAQVELLSLLNSHNIDREGFLSDSRLIEEKWKTETVTLPSQKTDKGNTIYPVLSGQILSETGKVNSIFCHSWQVEGFRLTPLESVKLLEALPLNTLQSNQNYIGSDLHFFSHIYRWSLDLLARGKFLPGIFQQEDGTVKSCWQPLLDSNIDRARFTKFIQLMPPACCAYQQQEEDGKKLREPQQLLLGFLSSIVDAQLRDWLDFSANLNKDYYTYSWLQSLAENENQFQAEAKQVDQLETAINNWTLPIQEYLVNPYNEQLGQNQFRVCFSLIPPKKVESKSNNWQLKYYLQALDNADFLFDSQLIWQYPLEQINYQNRTIEKPQETLLKGLGLASRLYSNLEASLQESQPTQCELEPIQVYEFIRSSAWQLQNNGLGVILPPGLASGEGEKRLGVKIQAQVNQKKGERLGLQSLLEFNLEVAMGEHKISKTEFKKLMAQKSPLVKVNGEWFALQPADVRAAQTILEGKETEIKLSVEDALRLSTGDTKTLARLPVVTFEASGVLQEFINVLNNNQAIETIKTPENFQGKLRPYQIRGMSWLTFLERWGLGACLADDMGLGKTIQLIAFILNLKAENALRNPTLLVCPTSVLNNWEREIKRFAPTISTVIHHGDQRPKGKAFAKAVKDKDLVITSYALVYRDEKTLQTLPWQGIVVDEAQNIKNPQAKQSQSIRKLTAGFRIALTGTPVENRLGELWSILDFLNPGFLGTRQFFQRRFAIPIEKYGDQDSLQTLRSLVRPFMLRRLKTDKEIIQDLPDKQEMNVFCGLSTEQGQLYQQLVDQSLSEIEDLTGIKRRGMILTLLMKLKQICNHPAQFLKQKKLGLGERSGKLLRLEEMLEELVEEGDRALIFTQFAEWGKLLKPYLENKVSSEVLFLYGATRRKQRQEMIDRFQNDPDGPAIFILSLKAGGTGLNLTRANHVFHIDRWWNPAVENQATDRAFRIGQKRNVQVHKFVCTGTLEERINDTLESKKQLAEQTVDAGEQWLTELDTDQLRNLLLLDRQAIIS